MGDVRHRGRRGPHASVLWGGSLRLHAIGATALREGSTAILAISGEVRGGFGLAVFLTGLLADAVGAILTALAVWRSGVIAPWSAAPFAIGFALFIPQFFGSPPVRIAHGALVLFGCLWLGYELWRSSTRSTST